MTIEYLIVQATSHQDGWDTTDSNGNEARFKDRISILNHFGKENWTLCDRETRILAKNILFTFFKKE